MVMQNHPEDFSAASASVHNQIKALRSNVHFEKQYEIMKHLGDGKFGKVYHVKDRSNGNEYAAKFIKLKKEGDKADVEREVSILNQLGHPKIVKIHDAFCTVNHNVVLIMEIVRGGELFDRIADENYVVSERNVALIIRQLCEAISYIHRQHIIHLDIKPENIMLMSQKCNEIKLIDFGLARFYDGEEDLKFMAGTPEFAAPEVIKFETLDFHTDMWSVGVITYILLSGYSPFLGDNIAETYCNVEKGEWSFTEEFDEISDEAKDFISKLLIYNKDLRMLPLDCLAHPWIAKDEPSKVSISDKTRESAKRKLRNTVICANFLIAMNRIRAMIHQRNMNILQTLNDETEEVNKMHTEDVGQKDVPCKKEEKKPESNSCIEMAKKSKTNEAGKTMKLSLKGEIKKKESKKRTIPTMESSLECYFSKKSIKRGIIRRIKSESFSAVSASFRSNIRDKVMTSASTSVSFTRRKVITPKRVVKRSDDAVLTPSEMLPIARRASLALAKNSKLNLNFETKPPMAKQENMLSSKKASPEVTSVLKSTGNISKKSKVLECPETNTSRTLSIKTKESGKSKNEQGEVSCNKSASTKTAVDESKTNVVLKKKSMKQKNEPSLPNEIITAKELKTSEVQQKTKPSISTSSLSNKASIVKPKTASNGPELPRSSSHKENKEGSFEKKTKKRNDKLPGKCSTPDRGYARETLIESNDEFSFDVLKDKLLRRVSGTDEQLIKRELRPQTVNLPGTYTSSVRDKLKKFEKLTNVS